MPFRLRSTFATWNRVAGRIFQAGVQDSLLRRFARSAIWSTGGTAIYQGASLLSLVLAARFIGAAQFGRVGAIQSTVAMFGVLGGLGLGITSTKYIAECRDRDREKAGAVIGLTSMMTLALASLVCLSLYLMAPRLAAGSLHDPSLGGPLRAGAILLFVNCALTHALNILAGFEAFPQVAKINAIRGVFLLPAVIYGARRAGIEGVISGLVCASVVGCAFAVLAVRAQLLRHRMRVIGGRMWSQFPLLGSFSLPAFLVGSITWPAMWVVVSILAGQTAGYVELGLLNAGLQWRNVITILPLLIAEPALPIMANLLAQGEAAQCRRLLRTNLTLGLAMTFVLAALVIASSGHLLKAYGEGFAGGRMVFVLCVASSLFMVPASLIAQWVASTNRMWASFGIHLVWAAGSVAGAYLLSPRFGARGVAGAYFASYGIELLLFCVVARNMLLGGRVREHLGLTRPEKPAYAASSS